MENIINEIRNSKTFLIVKEIAKLACKNVIPCGEIIVDAIDSFDKLEKQIDQQKVEEILKVVITQGQELLKLAEQMNVYNSEQFEILAKLPITINYLNKISDELKNISGIKEFLTQEFNELKIGQKKILATQDKILMEIQNSSNKKVIEQVIIHKQKYLCPTCKGDGTCKRSGISSLLLGCGYTIIIYIAFIMYFVIFIKSKSIFPKIEIFMIIVWFIISKKLEKITCQRCQGTGFIE
mgnify:CR=1 FL=1